MDKLQACRLIQICNIDYQLTSGTCKMLPGRQMMKNSMEGIFRFSLL